jgi:WD40 repeat protein
VVISGSDDGSMRVWDLAKRRAVRRRLRRIRLRHAAPVLAAVLTHRQPRIAVIVGYQDSVSQTWDLSASHLLSMTTVPGGAGVSAITILALDHVLYANGNTLAQYGQASAAVPVLTIELDSEIRALATYGTSTVVAATELGLVALDIPTGRS